MRSQPDNRLLILAIVTSVILAVLLFAARNRLSFTGVIPCTESWAEHLMISLGLASLPQLFFIGRLPGRQFKMLLAMDLLSILVVFWLGAYRISPLGYSTGQIPNLRGFQIIRANRDSTIENNAIVSLKRGSAAGINTLLVDKTSQCIWNSAAGAALEDPFSCDTAYVPPNADHDTLRLRVRSSCGLPDSAGQLRISILP
jgi:hypothetical protein